MTDRLDRALAEALERVRDRRDALEEAERRLQDILTEGREALPVIGALAALERAFGPHETRAEDLIDLVLEEAPRLEGRTRLLMAEHAVLAETTARLRSELEAGAPLPDLRPTLLGLARTIRSHLSHASDLLWEAIGAEVAPAD